MTSLKTISLAVFDDREPFRAHRSVANGGKDALDRIRRSQMIPVFGGEVVERQYRLAILRQAVDRLVVLHADFSVNTSIAISAADRVGAQ